jgi:hypothetical protein
MHQPRQAGYVSSWHPPLLSLAGRFGLVLVAFLPFTGIASAQSPSTPPPQSQTQKPPATVADAARQTKSKQGESAPQKVYTNDEMAALKREDISIAGTPTPTANDPNTKGEAQASPASAEPPNDTAKAAAYWRARFTAARQKLAQDEKALPVLQSQLELERVQQCSVDEDTGQVYSDTFMDLLDQIDAMKLTIQEDKQALTDLHDEFRHAGGLPGWIR